MKLNFVFSGFFVAILSAGSQLSSAHADVAYLCREGAAGSAIFTPFAMKCGNGSPEGYCQENVECIVLDANPGKISEVQNVIAQYNIDHPGKRASKLNDIPPAERMKAYERTRAQIPAHMPEHDFIQTTLACDSVIGKGALCPHPERCKDGRKGQAVAFDTEVGPQTAIEADNQGRGASEAGSANPKGSNL